MKKTSKKPEVSVVIPVFNEEKTIAEVITALRKTALTNLEIVVVNDGSTDQTAQVLKKLAKQIDQVIDKENGGKGSALQLGFSQAQGEIIVIQDADLEYDPQEIESLLQPIKDGRADVVYGSRFVGSKPHRVVYYSHYLANLFLTTLSNIFTNLNLTDMETGYKAFKKSYVVGLSLKERGFGIEPELTAKFAAQKARIYEVGISYHGRTYEEGKKIGFSDFLKAIQVIILEGLRLR